MSIHLSLMCIFGGDDCVKLLDRCEPDRNFPLNLYSSMDISAWPRLKEFCRHLLTMHILRICSHYYGYLLLSCWFMFPLHDHSLFFIWWCKFQVGVRFLLTVCHVLWRPCSFCSWHLDMNQVFVALMLLCSLCVYTLFRK